MPRAAFRGPQAGRAIVPVTPQMQQHTAQQLLSQIRQQNPGQAFALRPGATRDTVGNLIPNGARVLDPATGTAVSRSFRNVVDRVGRPTNPYAFVPHPDGDYGHGGRHGNHTGHRDHHGWGGYPWFAISLWYPFYFSDPFWYAWWYPGYYPSVYSYWGWTPGWIYPARAYYDPYAYSYVATGCGYADCRYGDSGSTYAYGAAVSTSPALDYAGLGQAVADLRAAWSNGDIAVFAKHLSDEVDIQVYFDGRYTYSTKTSDFYTMTADTMATTRTVSVDFADPVWISASEAFLTGNHVFDDPQNERHTVYLSYRLRQLGSDWYVVAVGSSTQPIASPYQDFRTG